MKPKLDWKHLSRLFHLSGATFEDMRVVEFEEEQLEDDEIVELEVPSDRFYLVRKSRGEN